MLVLQRAAAAGGRVMEPDDTGSPVVVFDTASDIEASVVMALLDSHGIGAFRVSGNPQAIWPMAVTSLGRIQVAVAAPVAEEARRVIDSHREERGPARRPPARRSATRWSGRSATSSRTGGCWSRRSRIGRARRKTPRATAPTTSRWSSWATRCWGSWWPTGCSTSIPDYDEGQKSKIKATVVSTQALARHAEAMRLGDYLILGRGEEKTGGRDKPALLADAFEAVVAAIYIDGGLDAAATFLRHQLKDAVDAGRDPSLVVDYKSALQERLQALGRPLPHYRAGGRVGPRPPEALSRGGGGGGEVRGAATGRAKKEAEQDAARQALASLDAARDGPSRPETAGGRYCRASVDLDDAPALALVAVRARVGHHRRVGSGSRPPARRALAAAARTRTAAPRAPLPRCVGGAGRQCSRTQTRSSGSAKL